MGDRTSIEWTDATWTPIRARRRILGSPNSLSKVGWHCAHVSEGCRNCYAEAMNLRLGTGLPYKPGHESDVEIFLDEKMLLAPLRWKKPRRIFVCSMTDLFGDFVTDDMIDRMFAVMALCGSHVFQVLTKRSDRMRAYFAGGWRERVAVLLNEIKPSGLWDGNVYSAASALIASGFLPNVWLGVSVEDQAAADARIPDLLATPAAVRFLSCEPLLVPLDLRAHFLLGQLSRITFSIDWVIAGGESGRGARPMHPDWARGLRDQCAAAGVPFLFKQWGEWATGVDIGDVTADGVDFGVSGTPTSAYRHHAGIIEPDESLPDMLRVGKKRAGRMLDGVTHDEFPA